MQGHSKLFKGGVVKVWATACVWYTVFELSEDMPPKEKLDTWEIAYDAILGSKISTVITCPHCEIVTECR